MINYHLDGSFSIVRIYIAEELRQEYETVVAIASYTYIAMVVFRESKNENKPKCPIVTYLLYTVVACSEVV